MAAAPRSACQAASDRIGSLTGNEWGDLSFYTDNQIPVWVPIWDYAGGNGANGWYHIVGFGAIVFTGDNEHAKWLEGAAIESACKPGTEITGHPTAPSPGARSRSTRPVRSGSFADEMPGPGDRLG